MTIGNKEVFAKNLKKFIAMSGKDRKDVAAALNIPYSTLTDWANARKYPRIDSIERLAEYFGISKSDLIEDFEQKEKDNDVLATIIVQLRTNRELLELTEKLISLDKVKLKGLSELLDTFI